MMKKKVKEVCGLTWSWSKRAAKWCAFAFVIMVAVLYDVFCTITRVMFNTVSIILYLVVPALFLGAVVAVYRNDISYYAGFAIVGTCLLGLLILLLFRFMGLGLQVSNFTTPATVPIRNQKGNSRMGDKGVFRNVQ